MNLSRRQFNGLLLVGTAGASFGLEGCLFSTIEQDVLDYVPVALQAVDSILDLVAPAAGAVATMFTPIIEAALSAVEKSIQDWKDADATQKPGLLGDIIATLQTVMTDLQNFLSAVQVNAPKIYSVVEALASIILGVLQYFVNKLSPATPASKAGMVGGRQIEPLRYSPKQFKAAFNAKAVSLGHPESQIK